MGADGTEPGEVVEMPMARTWEGLTFQARAHRAAGRAIIGIGMAVSADTKRLTHRVSGTLARSIHAAPIGADHEGDENSALTQDLMMSRGFLVPTPTPAGPSLEVGSWLPYACAEWIGRDHPGITQGLEGVRGARATSIVMQAFREEGL